MARKKWNLERLRSESSYWRSCILITAAHFDLFGWMGKQEKSSRALAAHFGGHAVGWETFLNALCGMGLMRKRGAKFSNSAFSLRHLSGAGATLLLPNYDAWNSWGGLNSILTTGKRPKTQKPFISDRAQAKRLLALWTPCPADCALSDREITPGRLPNSAGCRRRAGKFCRSFLPSLSSSSGNSC
jgi:hypothetical protein